MTRHGVVDSLRTFLSTYRHRLDEATGWHAITVQLRLSNSPDPVLDVSVPYGVAVAIGNAIEHYLDTVADPRPTTALDGATTPPGEFARPATPGEFAALWNSLNDAERQLWVDRTNENADAANLCFIADHIKRLHNYSFNAWHAIDLDTLATGLERGPNVISVEPEVTRLLRQAAALLDLNNRKRDPLPRRPRTLVDLLAIFTEQGTVLIQPERDLLDALASITTDKDTAPTTEANVEPITVTTPLPNANRALLAQLLRDRLNTTENPR